jgi:hypothetical protein
LAERSFVAEIACALRMSERSAQKLIAESDTLVDTLPASFSALCQGRIGYAQARVIVDEAYGLDAADRRSLEDTVIGAAATQTPARLRARVRRVRERLHPETINTRLKAAVADRSVSVETAADGMAWLNLYVQAPLVAGIDDRVGQVAAAMKQHGDPRTITQLRADIATMLLLGDGTGIPGNGVNPGDKIANTDADTDADSNATAGDDGADDNRVVPAAFTRQHSPGDAMGPLAVLLGQVRPQTGCVRAGFDPAGPLRDAGNVGRGDTHRCGYRTTFGRGSAQLHPDPDRSGDRCCPLGGTQTVPATTRFSTLHSVAGWHLPVPGL